MLGVRGRTAHLAWYRTDEAPADVAFLHGFSDSARCWEPLIHEVPGLRALGIDARGHGESGLPETPVGQSGQHDDAALVLSSQPREAGVVVVGHSMGAMSAALLAAAEPSLVRALVLEDPPPGERRAGQPEGSRWSMPSWLADARALELPERIAHCRSENPGWPDDELEPWAVSKAQLNPRLFDQPPQEATPLTDVLAAVTCPVLLIHGDTERGSLISDEYAARCAQVAAGEFRAVRVAGAGHSVRRDNRTRYLAELTAFLHRHR